MLNAAVLENNGTAVPVIAQWDTGATATCVSYDVVKQLNLIPIGKIDVQTPSGVGTMNQYLVDLVLNNEIMFKRLRVMDSCIGSQGIGVLIGMDIISLGDFSVSNFHGDTYFSFRIPSQAHIEYTK